MNTTIGHFVLVPYFLQLSDYKLKYLDVLVYAALRSFKNNQNDDCFPKHETVGKLVGLSKRFVIEAIKRLENAKFINVARSEEKRKSNHYSFPIKIDSWKLCMRAINKSLLADANITTCEKAMFICLQQFFHHGINCMNMSLDDLAFGLGLTKATINKQFQNLINKGVIIKIINKHSKSANYTINEKYVVTFTAEKKLQPLKVY